MGNQPQPGRASSLYAHSNLPNPTSTPVDLALNENALPSNGASRTNLTDASPHRGDANEIDAGAETTLDGPLEHAIDRLIAASVLSPIADDLRWAPARHQPAWGGHRGPSVEIGRHIPNEAFCRRANHRDSDWKTQDGRIVCGICHPPTQPDPWSGAFGQEERRSRRPSEGLEL